jgi:hypothetical protein
VRESSTGEVAGAAGLGSQSSSGAGVSSFTRKSFPAAEAGSSSAAAGRAQALAAGPASAAAQASAEDDGFGRGRRYGHAQPQAHALQVEDFDDVEDAAAAGAAQAGRAGPKLAQQGGLMLGSLGSRAGSSVGEGADPATAVSALCWACRLLWEAPAQRAAHALPLLARQAGRQQL